MKKMISRRSFLAAAGVSAAALALTACGGSSSSTAASTAASTAGSTAAASGDTIKVGVMGPMTGDVSVYGLAVINGASLYMKQVNADGGNGDLTHIFVAVDLHHRELGVQGAALCLRFRGLHLLLKVGHHGLSLGTGVGILVAVVGVQAASRQQEHHTQHDADKPGGYFTHSFHVSLSFFP